MSNKSFYFTHDYYARTDLKMVALMMKLGQAGIGIYWCLIEMLYESDACLELNPEKLAFALHTTPELISSVINDFDLFVVGKNDRDKGTFTSKSVRERIAIRFAKGEQAKAAAKKGWEIRNAEK
jgi:hypothetical protein